MLVEGEETEMKVYPKWIRFLAPQYVKVDRLKDITRNSYYIYSGFGTPSIYNHISNAVEDIANHNETQKNKVDYLTCFKNSSDNLTLFINPHTYPLEFAHSYIQ